MVTSSCPALRQLGDILDGYLFVQYFLSAMVSLRIWLFILVDSESLAMFIGFKLVFNFWWMISFSSRLECFLLEVYPPSCSLAISLIGWIYRRKANAMMAINDAKKIPQRRINPTRSSCAVQHQLNRLRFPDSGCMSLFISSTSRWS